MPEVSVIIPCYNLGHYLAHAIQSVLAQTCADWESIIVDDGSTDDTATVAARFNDPRFGYVYQENEGLSAARNAGIRVAQGKYLAFLDADDEWEPDFLKVCIATLASQPAVTAVVTLNKFIDESGVELPRMGGRVFRPEKFREQLLEGGFFPPHAILVRVDSVKRAGMFDRSLTCGGEDWDLWLRIAGSGGLFLSISEPLARYRVSTGSMSTNAAWMHTNRMAVLNKHFGPPEGDSLSWATEKRRGYAFAYRMAALGYIAQQDTDRGWRYLAQAVKIEPNLLRRLDTFYESALGDQPRGYRGDATQLDISANGAEMLQRLDALFTSADPAAQALRRTAYGNAYLALAMLSDQAGDWDAARGYLRKAIRFHPLFLRDPSVCRRLIKLSLGRRLVGRIRSVRTANE